MELLLLIVSFILKDLITKFKHSFNFYIKINMNKSYKKYLNNLETAKK